MESSDPNKGPEGKGDVPNRASRAYRDKFKEMRKYIPFLDKMIARLHGSNGSAREGQLAKMKSLYAILNNTGNHRLTLQSLEKCDSILRNLYQKVQREEEEELMLQSKNKDGKTLPPSTTSKSKENEPNPHWVLGASQKPPTGFKKNFKNQKLAHVKAPGHAHVPQSIANRSLRVDKPVQSKETSKQLTKSPPMMSDRKSEKTKAKENKEEIEQQQQQQPPSNIGRIRVRRLSGDKLSTFSTVVDNPPVAGPSFVQDQPSTSSNFFGNLRIESVVSAANCDAETRQTIMNSLHNEATRKRPREQYELATLEQNPTMEYLINFYKCMGVNCHFSSNRSSDFLDHLKKYHPVKVTSTAPWFHCAYCDVKTSCRTALLRHLKVYHCHSNKQCAYCNYRSLSYNNVMYHHDIVHVDKTLKIYNCRYVEPLIPRPDMPKRTDVILPYRCMFGNGSDGSSCYYSSTFVWNLMERHLLFHGYNGHKCHMCKKPVLLTEMNDHYSTHLFGLYQCMYCIFAAPTGEVMRAHLSGSHPDLKPEACKREFKPGAFHCLAYRNMPLDVELNKLKIVNFEDLWVPVESVIDGELMVPTSIQTKTATATVGTQLSKVVQRPRTQPSFQVYRRVDHLFPKNTPKPAASHASQSSAATRVINNEPEVPPFALWSKSLKPRIVKRSRPPPTIDHEVIEISSSPERERSPERDSKIIRKDSIKPKKEFIVNEVIENNSSSESDSDPEIDQDHIMCFLCNKIFHSEKKALHHVTTEHKVNKTTIVDYSSGRLVRPEIVTSDSPTKPLQSKKTFTMNEIHLLPKKAILNSPIVCDHCGFSNVVVKNLKIHLQNHASGKEVASKLLVNPVPCLETNEKMFDKMVNLAGSSHSQTAKDADLKHVFEPPKYVDPFIRYSCDVCNHLTLNDENLLAHLKTIHNASHYNCIFCQGVSVPIDKTLNHLKMHDRNLYKCPYCNLCHWQKSQVERHVMEKHREKKPLVLIVRDLRGNKTNEEAVQPDGLKICQWQCASCETVELEEAVMKEHCKTVHGLQEWCKCCLCDFASDDNVVVIKHFKDHHQNEKLHVVQLYHKVYKNLPSFDNTVDMGLPRRRTRNLREHIRGHIFSENLKVPDVPEPGTYKCPTCDNYTSKSKLDFIAHMWDDYRLITTLPSSAEKKQYETYINRVIWRLEIEMKADKKEVSVESSKDSDSTTKDPPRLKRAYRKRSATKVSATSEKNKVDSDDTSNSKRPRCRPEKEHTCTLCSFQCLDANGLKDHMAKRHPSTPPMVTATVSQPNDADATEEEVIYECQICGRVDYKNALHDHFKTTHPFSSISISIFDEELFKCNICNLINPSYERLMNHSTTVHPNCSIDIAAVEAAKNTQPPKKSPEMSNIKTNLARSFSCSLCRGMFNTHTACRIHIKNQHKSKAACISVVNEQPEKIPVAKKSTSKRVVESRPHDKLFLSKVILKDLGESH
ncbi:uncharacterized protein LOC111052760 isoform X2 [Nilaparvata lugens]|uniref:uncharacterized protein LOC111052760 isoform X2 n=1 Tax=Nilaparvata lugens TaxID=108931 RepID=UPI00193C896E|nr:uncharacterized protein LOC111052760 isoform X2 [Nilaparvata lugens]